MPFDLAGAIDLHVHAAPSLFPRWGDGFALAEACAQARMAGFVLKSHHGSSVEAAAAVQRAHPDLAIRGGLVLNHFVGGLNPSAVDAAVTLGAAVIWLPTIHAEFHAQACGTPGGFSFQKNSSRRPPASGITLLDDRGRLLESVCEILRILDGTKVVLASGHVSYREFAALHQYVRAHKLDLDLLVNHVRFFAPDLSAAQIDELADERTWFEICFFSTCAMARATTPREVATLMAQRPDRNWIVASDAGQKDNPAPPDALRGFCAELESAGCDAALLRRAIVDNPTRLLGIS